MQDDAQIQRSLTPPSVSRRQSHVQMQHQTPLRDEKSTSAPQTKSRVAAKLAILISPAISNRVQAAQSPTTQHVEPRGTNLIYALPQPNTFPTHRPQFRQWTGYASKHNMQRRVHTPYTHAQVPSDIASHQSKKFCRGDNCKLNVCTKHCSCQIGKGMPLQNI